jgi:metal-responsive CopG/Arc/MetJ family transcriptional regulator
MIHCTSMTSMTSSTIVAATTTDMTVKLGITLPKSILQKIDLTRVDIPRSRYIRRAIENYLRSSSKDIDNNDNYNIAAAKKRRK